MKNKETTITWAILILVSIAVWGYAFRGMFHECPEPEPKMFIEKFIELQVEAGCKMLDARVGPEVKEKFNAKMIAEEPEYFNRCAAPYFAASGAPRKEQ